MIVVNAVIVATEETISEIKVAIRVMETRSRAEDGCHDYTFSVELNQPDTLRITEKWEDISALEAHFNTPHMADFQQAMAENPPRSVAANFYEVTEVPAPGQ